VPASGESDEADQAPVIVSRNERADVGSPRNRSAQNPATEEHRSTPRDETGWVGGRRGPTGMVAIGIASVCCAGLGIGFIADSPVGAGRTAGLIACIMVFGVGVILGVLGGFGLHRAAQMDGIGKLSLPFRRTYEIAPVDDLKRVLKRHLGLVGYELEDS